METKKKCVLILPYFGDFNQYFPLFLKSCAANPSYDWIIFTDNPFHYECPKNVRVMKTTLENIRTIASEKFGFEVALKSPYKLCDYKPAYGFLFEEYINDYEYWGHCDCDLIFGNLEKLLTPLLREGYDKLFAAGHLTVYKNTPENNRRFMKPLNGRYLYKEAYTTDRIFVLDEDYGGHDNVHFIFLKDGVRVYENDLCINPSIRFAKFVRAYYEPSLHQFMVEPYRKARYYWDHGDIVRIEPDGNAVMRTSFLYLHLQMRKMRVGKNLDGIIEILPDRFIAVGEVPKSVKELHTWSIGFPYQYWIDVYSKKIHRRWNNLMKRK